jgi:hypothetical protein
MICEETEVTIKTVGSMKDLIDPKTGEYYTTSKVNVTSDVYLANRKLLKLPVQFGTVGGDFHCYDNELTSLEGVAREIGGDLSCSDNKLTSLEGIHKIIKRVDGVFYCARNPIKTGGIGLILIEGLTRIPLSSTDEYYDAFKIIKKYLGQGKKGLLLCQDELIDAGYEKYAKL